MMFKSSENKNVKPEYLKSIKNIDLSQYNTYTNAQACPSNLTKDWGLIAYAIRHQKISIFDSYSPNTLHYITTKESLLKSECIAPSEFVVVTPENSKFVIYKRIQSN